MRTLQAQNIITIKITGEMKMKTPFKRRLLRLYRYARRMMRSLVTRSSQPPIRAYIRTPLIYQTMTRTCR